MNSKKFKKQSVVKVAKIFPPEAKCLFNRAFVEAQILAGKENWRYVPGASREVLRHACTCPKHSQLTKKQQKASFASL